MKRKVQSNIFFCKNFNKSHLTNTHYIPAFCTQHVPRCHPNDHHTQFPSLLQNLPRLFRLTETIHQPDVCPLKMLLFPYNTAKSIFIQYLVIKCIVLNKSISFRSLYPTINQLTACNPNVILVVIYRIRLVRIMWTIIKCIFISVAMYTIQPHIDTPTTSTKIQRRRFVYSCCVFSENKIIFIFKIW